jgi:AcrR family transcriptional regulator
VTRARSDAAPATKGDRTKQAILQAARRQFHAHGYDGASVRAIAAEASIDPAMVIRYFGSKPALFTAAVGVDLRLPDMKSVPKSRRGEHLVEHFISRWEGNDGFDSLVTLLRSAISNDEARAQLRQVFGKQVRGMVRAIVDPDEVDRRSLLVTSQMLGLALSRYVLEFPQATRMPKEEVVRVFAPAVQRHLHGSLGAGRHSDG